MTNYAITPPKQVTVPIEGSDDVFPIRRIYCIGRNYAEHTIEMGHDPDREDPFFFQKNPNNIDVSGDFPYPPKSSNVHHELELVVALKSGGRDIKQENAMDHVFGYAVGLDMTRRDLQGISKKTGRPWEIGKAFENSAPMGTIVPVSESTNPDAGLIELKVNGETRQKGDLSQMIWKVSEMISYLSDYYEIAAGDLIMSGTPAGVGPVVKGDVMVGTVEGVGELTITVI
ncbi:fumarylacetoacetate hydrolase family protein [Kiloniella sp.]|uniref:fumarylacetoacetate hydrolase family protein n=1 Tax=Kiloniella sp. TaxID=1938587 RepID=UPI003B02A417